MTGAIVQARLDSTRLCHKVFRPIGGKIVLDWVIDAAMDAKKVDAVCVTTPDLAIARYVRFRAYQRATDKKRMDAFLYVGHRNPLLEYYQCGRMLRCETIVRLTGDCPMLTGKAIDATIESHMLAEPKVRYTYNGPNDARGADGVDVEVFDFAALEQAHREAGSDEREHVSTWIRKHLQCQYLDRPDGEFLSVNTKEDLERVKSLMVRHWG